jgi:nucleotide-binding universal stress UspA family protein
MFSKILLAIDGSEHANRASKSTLELVIQLGNVSITILHVSTSAPSRRELLQTNFDVHSLLENQAHRIVRETEDAFKSVGILYTFQVALGDPATEIIDRAKEGEYDLIIMGKRGLDPLRQVLLGSVSQKVLQHAPCPVMIVK